MDGPIASAVLLPEPQDADYEQRPASPPNGQKRPQSSVSEQDVKRQRLNSIDANANLHPDRRSSIAGSTPAATVSGRRERGRERRLFGAALGALSQNSATAAQRKRSEIEKRQKAQRELEDKESDQRKLERGVQRKAQRQREQRRFERDLMRTRHANLLHMAHFLRTEAEPRLYYKPWETTANEDDHIQDQIAEAKEIIRQEQEEYHVGEAKHGGREVFRNTNAELDAGANFPIGKEPFADTPTQQPTANGATIDSGPSPKDPELREDHAKGFTSGEAVSVEQAAEPELEQRQTLASHDAAADEEANKDMLDDNAEEVVEAAEDTVIY